MTDSKACAKDLIFGPWRRATKKGSDKCDSGFVDPIEGGTCWTCPSGGNRTVYPVNQGKACEYSSKAQKRGPDTQLLELSSAAEANLKKISQDFSDKTKDVMGKINEIYTKVNGPLKQIFTNSSFANNIKNGNYDAIWNQIKSELEPLVNDIKSLEKLPQYQNLRKFTVMSISVSGSASAGVGVGVEQGLLIYFENVIKLKGYYIYGVVGGLTVGVSNSVSVGIWKNTIDCGAGYGVNLGFSVPTPAGVGVGGGGGIWFDGNKVCNKDWASFLTLDAIEGLTLNVTVGVGPLPVDVNVAFVSQMIYEVSGGRLKSFCEPCGGKGQPACSLTERFPSCDIGLIEKCGICQ